MRRFLVHGGELTVQVYAVRVHPAPPTVVVWLKRDPAEKGKGVDLTLAEAKLAGQLLIGLAQLDPAEAWAKKLTMVRSPFRIQVTQDGISFAFVLRWFGLTLWKATLAELSFDDAKTVGHGLVAEAEFAATI